MLLTYTAITVAQHTTQTGDGKPVVVSQLFYKVSYLIPRPDNVLTLSIICKTLKKKGFAFRGSALLFYQFHYFIAD